jgi:hypothetical protein
VKFNTETLKKAALKLTSAYPINRAVPISATISINTGTTEATLVGYPSNGEYVAVSLPGVAGITDTVPSTFMERDIFCSLIMQLTTAETDIQITESAVKILANGEYIIPSISGTFDGQAAAIESTALGTETNTLSFNRDNLLQILARSAHSLADAKVERSILNSAYLGSMIICTDRNNASYVPMLSPIAEPPVLMPPRLMEVLQVVDDEKVSIKYDERFFQYESSTVAFLIANTWNDPEEYPTASLLPLYDAFITEEPLGVSCGKVEFLQALSRLMVFTDYLADKGVLVLEVTSDSIYLHTLTDSAKESVHHHTEGITGTSTFYLDISAINLMVNRTIDAKLNFVLSEEMGENAIAILDNGTLHVVSTVEVS